MSICLCKCGSQTKCICQFWWTFFPRSSTQNRGFETRVLSLVEAYKWNYLICQATCPEKNFELIFFVRWSIVQKELDPSILFMNIFAEKMEISLRGGEAKLSHLYHTVDEGKGWERNLAFHRSHFVYISISRFFFRTLGVYKIYLSKHSLQVRAYVLHVHACAFACVRVSGCVQMHVRECMCVREHALVRLRAHACLFVCLFKCACEWWYICYLWDANLSQVLFCFKLYSSWVNNLSGGKFLVGTIAELCKVRSRLIDTWKL